MPAPTLLSTSPVAAENEVYKNQVLTATFDVALDENSVNSGTFVLQNLDMMDLVQVTTSLSSSGLVVSITPVRHLIDSTAYKLTIVGANTALTTGPVKSSTGEDLAVTSYITFTTGTEIEVSGLTKSEEQQALEGEIDLPSNIQVIDPPGYLTIVATDPQNRDFGVSPSIQSITVEFSDPIATSTLDESTFIVEQGPYYEEDEPFLAFPDTSTGECNFQWQEPDDTSGNLIDFSDVSGTLSVDSNIVTWTPSSFNFPSNAKIKITLTTGIESTDGLALETSRTFSFYTRPCPWVVSVDRIRDEFMPYSLSTFTDDIIGKAIYKNSIQALDMIRWQFNPAKINPTFRAYILNMTIVDIFTGLRIEEELLAGQFKRVGDILVKYDSDMGKSMPAKQRLALEKALAAKDMLSRRFNGVMIPTVKGRLNPEQRAIWRTRLWKQDLTRMLEGYTYGNKMAGNTADERATKVPGLYDIL